MNSRITSTINRIHPILWHVLCLAISIAVFSVILLNRSPNFLRPLSMSLRTGFGLVIPAATLVVYLAFRMPGRLGVMVSMVITLSLFSMPLAGLWASGLTQTTVLSGILPLYDAEAYYIDALRLINGVDFSVFSARRPLFPSLLSVLLSITNFNLMASLAVLTGIAGLACYFASKEIQRTHGTEMAVFVLMVLFLFYRAHSGVSMSENLGVALGVLGFGLLWRGAADRHLPLVWLGLLVTTLALNARAGAFFMLPLLILWTGWIFRGHKPVSWKALGIGLTAIMLGFALNLTLTRLIAVPAGVPFANFSYTLYGLASGGRSWAYVFEAHPEVLQLQEPEQSRKIYQLAFELIRENPIQTVRGAFFNWKMLFSDTWYNVYAYIGGENWGINVAARWVMYLLGLLGIYAWARDRTDPIKSLIMISIVGVFISVPVLPPTDAYRMRPYAASIIILGALPGLGMYFLLERMKTNIFQNHPVNGSDLPSLTVVTSVLLILTTVIGPLIIKSIARPMERVPVRCAPGLDSVLVRFDDGTFFNVQRQNRLFLDWMPDYHIGFFQRNAHSLGDLNLTAWADKLEPPKTVYLTLDYSRNEKVIVAAPIDLMPAAGSVMQVCGNYENAPALDEYHIFYAEEIEILPP